MCVSIFEQRYRVLEASFSPIDGEILFLLKMATQALPPVLYQKFLEDDSKGIPMSPSDARLAMNEVSRLKTRSTKNPLGPTLQQKLDNLERILAKHNFGRGTTPLPTNNPLALGTGGATNTTGPTQPILTRSKTATPQLTNNSNPPPLFTAAPQRTGLT